MSARSSPRRDATREESRDSVLRQRRRRALGIVVALFAGIAVSGGVEHLARPGVLTEAPTLFADAETAFEQEIGETGTTTAADALAALPAFGEEAALPENATDVRVSAEAGLVGYVTSVPAANAYSALAAALCEKGWTEQPSGLAICGSFTKDAGALRWIFATCTEVGAQTSVVMQCRGEER